MSMFTSLIKQEPFNEPRPASPKQVRSWLWNTVRHMNLDGKKPGDEHAELLALVLKNTVEEGDCVLWQKTKHAPKICIQGQNISTRRVILECLGKTTQGGNDTHYISKCRNPRCVCAEHTREMTDLQAKVFHGKHGAYTSPLVVAKTAKIRRANSKYSEQLIEEIRESNESGQAWNKKVGIAASYVYSIRANRSRVEYSSPFAGLMRA